MLPSDGQIEHNGNHWKLAGLAGSLSGPGVTPHGGFLNGRPFTDRRRSYTFFFLTCPSNPHHIDDPPDGSSAQVATYYYTQLPSRSFPYKIKSAGRKRKIGDKHDYISTSSFNASTSVLPEGHIGIKVWTLYLQPILGVCLLKC